MKRCPGGCATWEALVRGCRNGGYSAALALIPLGLWFVVSMISLVRSDQLTAAAWLNAPVPAFLTILLVLALFAHAVVGLRSILDDYVNTRAVRVAVDLLVRALAIILGGASVLAVLKLFLGR
jgi:succinate dehydrogenase / fumarate reductase membrane anchor subunit